MTEIKPGSYIFFKDHMHLTPKGGILFPPDMGREGYEIFEKNEVEKMGMTRWGNINVGGAHILARCDGSHSIDEIIRELYENDYEKSVGPVISYLNMAEDNFTVEIRDSPFQGTPCVTGSFEYYHPLRILFEVTTRCNLKCFHCNASAGSDTGSDVPTEEFLSLLENLHNHGTRHVELTGGEPLMHPDFLQILDFCTERFDQVVIASNGLLIDEDLVEEFAKYTNVVCQISIDGSTPESHDKRRGVKGAFEKAVDAAQLLSSHGVFTRVMIAIAKDNKDEVEDIILLASELDVAGINYDIVRATGRGRDLEISPYDALTWLQEMHELTTAKYKGKMSFFYERKRREYSETCGAGTTMLTMGPGGNVRPCTYLPEDYIIGGNLFETKDFNTLFKTPMNEKFSTLEFPGGNACSDCDFYYHCQGCFCNGVLMYERIGEECQWGNQNKLEEWINFPF